jgi:Ca2+-binding EF-hand superfamily protein
MSKVSNYVSKILKDEKSFEEAALKAFKAIDHNNNKYLDFSEIENLLIKFSNNNNVPPPTKEQVQQLFNELDIDKNNKIDFNEFKKFFKLFLEKQK